MPLSQKTNLPVLLDPLYSQNNKDIKLLNGREKAIFLVSSFFAKLTIARNILLSFSSTLIRKYDILSLGWLPVLNNTPLSNPMSLTSIANK